MHALYEEWLPPSGVEFAATLKLTPSTLGQSSRREVLCNVVTARRNTLSIYEVREETATSKMPTEAKSQKKDDAMEGVKEERQTPVVQPASTSAQAQPLSTKFHLVREHRLHGVVTGLQAVKIISSLEDHLDRLLVSFKDAKIALLEWSTATQDLLTVSIHTYERAIQMVATDISAFTSELRVDPQSRCAALSLPKDAFAILPFYQTQEDIDMMDQEQVQSKDVPYSPSFILNLPSEVESGIRNVIDFTFLPGFSNPTVAVLYETNQTWTGRLNEQKDTVKMAFFTLDIVNRRYPVIGQATGLPCDCLSVLACPSTGGVMVIASNSIIYVDQSGRKVVLPVNGWVPRISDIALPTNLTPEEQARTLELEGSRSIFVDDKTAFVILKDGTIYPVELVTAGRVVSKLALGSPLAKTTIPSVLRRINNDYLLVGSTSGESALLRTSWVEEEIDDDVDMDANTSAAAPEQQDVEMDDDDDDDIYGPSIIKTGTSQKESAAPVSKKMRSVLRLSFCDALPAYGPIVDLTFTVGKNGDRPVAELVTATGSGHLGGFTLFQKDLPLRKKKKLPIISGARGVWSLPIRRSSSAAVAEHDTLIISTDANPSPGFSRLAVRATKGDLSVVSRVNGMTIGAGPFFQRTAILHVMTNAIRVLEPDGNERQIIKDMEGNVPRAKIKSCSICDPYVLIFREDDTIGLFIGETTRGKIRRKDMSPMGEKSSRYTAGGFFTDTAGVLKVYHQNADANTETTVPMHSVVDASSKSQWLVLVRPQGVVEIWTLPKLTLVFSTTLLATLQNVLTDSQEPPALSPPQDPPRKPQELDIEQILLTNLGQSDLKPHLLVLLRSGHLAIYEAFATNQAPVVEPPLKPRASSLQIQFVKIASRAFEMQRTDETEKGILAEQKKALRTFVPFACVAAPAGVFFTGDRPHWIVATDKGGVQMYPSGHAAVYAFSACTLWERSTEFLIYSEEGQTLCEWIPEYEIGHRLPMRHIPQGRAYSNVVYEPASSMIVAAASLHARFASFDEDGNQIWAPDGPGITEPTVECSTLELISPEVWATVDGYEFATNEFVNTMECVPLETVSTEAGVKHFIAVGTSIVRGEDLAVKGATYIFEVVEVVPDQSSGPKRWYRLKLRCRDDAKGPVTALCGINNYLVSSMGQKIFVRAFDLDERLVGVAFMDVGVYVTSLRALKNLLLIGDVVRGIQFVAFQEDPYKLVTLGRDVSRMCATTVDFFFAEEALAIVTTDENGVMSMYNYDPEAPDSHDGRLLLKQTEFNLHTDFRTSTLIARRTKDDPIIPQGILIFGGTDGTLSCLTPVPDDAAKRLQPLQLQLTRNMQHVAGLNPKALRIVRNEHVSRPLSKGILDGNLIAYFEHLPITRQDEMTRQIGTERATILRDWMSLSGTW
ncbi:CPSF A subunit region-domain-containing protein [Schizophyllum commune]